MNQINLVILYASQVKYQVVLHILPFQDFLSDEISIELIYLALIFKIIVKSNFD